MENFQKSFIEIYRDGSKAKQGMLKPYNVHTNPIAQDTKSQTEYFIEQIDEILKAKADIICFQGFSDLSVKNELSERKSLMGKMSLNTYEKYSKLIIQQKNWVKWFLEQEGYTFLEEKFPATSPEIPPGIPEKTLLGTPSQLSMIGTSRGGGSKEDRYSGLAICYKEQIADGR